MNNKPSYEELEKMLKQCTQKPALFECIFRAIPDAALLTDLNRIIIMVNPALSQIFGYAEDELIGKNSRRYYTCGNQYEKQGEIRFNPAAGEELQPYEMSYYTKNGEIVNTETVGTVVRDDEGNALGFLVIMKDITERIKARMDMQQANESLERMVKARTEELIKEQGKKQQYLDIAAVMLVALNKMGEITLINQQGCKMLQVREEEAIGRNWFDHFLPKREIASVKKVFHQLITGEGENVKYYENSVVTHDGEERMFAFHNTTLTGENGNVMGILFSGEDITDRKQMEEELKRRSLLLEEANVALKILLKQSGDARQELEKNILTNINELVTPYIEQIETRGTDKQQKAYLDILKTNLQQITASFSRNLFEQFPGLTPREIQVINSIKNGMSNKEIGALLCLSTRTVEKYRDKIRIKLGIRNKRVNLRTHILSFK
jgi:PAS domain S-box-containing protein